MRSAETSVLVLTAPGSTQGERGIKHRDLTGRGCSDRAKGDGWPNLGLMEEKVTLFTLHTSIINNYWKATEC